MNEDHNFSVFPLKVKFRQRTKDYLRKRSKKVFRMPIAIYSPSVVEKLLVSSSHAGCSAHISKVVTNTYDNSGQLYMQQKRCLYKKDLLLRVKF